MQPAIEEIIKEKFSNGIKNDSIDITRLREFCKKYGIEISDFNIEQIFEELIENNGRHYLREMLISEEEDEKIEEQVNKWINDFDFFEIEALLCKFENAKFSRKFKMYELYAPKIKQLKIFSKRLRNMKEACEQTGDEIEQYDWKFQKTLRKIKDVFEENGGEIERQKYFRELEHLTPDLARIMLKECFPRIRETEGYFKDTESIELPEGFKEKMRNAEKKLTELNFPVDQDNLSLLLCLEYGENIFEKYPKLRDNKLFNAFREKLRWRNKTNVFIFF